jgi:hypothetical protein
MLANGSVYELGLLGVALDAVGGGTGVATGGVGALAAGGLGGRISLTIFVSAIL